ncbi:MAG: amidase, partial [Thaumarchaeota archaeon]|nr:amidase [Nitrososphaerota archaeon]
PTIDMLPTSGVFPLGATLDHVGILTKTMEDLIDAFRAIARPDPKPQRVARSERKLGTIGIPGDYFFEGCDKTVSRNFRRAIEKIANSGQFKIQENINIPDHQRISRIRRSIQVKEASWFYEELATNPKKRELVGKDVLSFFDAGLKTGMMEYMVSSVERVRFIARMVKVFESIDFLAMPTCLTLPPKLDEILGKEAGAIRNKLVRNTEAYTLCGFPPLSMPTHKQGSNELPTANEISGSSKKDLEVLEAGREIWNFLHG